MITSSQASARGVSRLALSRLAKSGHLVRVDHGVYRAADAPADEHESLRAAWLSTDPGRTAAERLAGEPGVVVAYASASRLHGIGDLPADQHEFITPVRRQTQRPDIRFRQRILADRDVTVAQGLPVTGVERTVADLVEDRTDRSLVGDVLRDALYTKRLGLDHLQELLVPLAARNGFPRGDGQALLELLLENTGILAGLDATARRLVANPDATPGDVAKLAPDLHALSQLIRRAPSR